MKVVLIGIDGGMSYFIERFIKEGVMKNLKSLLKNGTLIDAYPFPPCDTPTNWTTIATGASPAEHGATGFYPHFAGEDIDFGLRLENRGRSFLSTNCHAEYIWDTLDKKGIKCLVVNYLCGWPASLKNGIMINGSGLPPHEMFPPIKIAVKKFPVELKLSDYTKIVLKSKDNKIFSVCWEGKNLATIKPNEWSKWLKINCKSPGEGKWTFGWIPWKPVIPNKVDVYFRVKAKKSEVTTTSFYTLLDYVHPKGKAEKILEVIKLPPVQKPKPKEKIFFTEIEVANEEARRLSEIVGYVEKEFNFDLYMLHFHLLDGLNHWYLAKLLPEIPYYTKEDRKDAWDAYIKGYKVVDNLIGMIVDKFDDEVVFIIVSDHAALPCWKRVNLMSFFVQNGLTKYKFDQKIGKYLVDWSKTKSFVYPEPLYVWVNLKGRDPKGIVSESEYEKVREGIIDLLMNLRDPSTGERVIQLALKREEAAFLGQDSEKCGDVIFFFAPGYTAFDGDMNHLNYYEVSPERFAEPTISPALNFIAAHVYYLPTAKINEFSNNSFLVFSGKRIKKQARVKRYIQLSDVTVTVANLFSLPPPKNCQGKVIHEILRK